MDPYAVLGVPPGASEEEIAAAYRREAKSWHPDRRPGARAQSRMAEVNLAYDLLRAGHDGPPPPRRSEEAGIEVVRTVPRRPRGSWLSPSTRRALGPELTSVLLDDEDVLSVAPASTRSSRALLALTDRRLLILLDDSVLGRVRAVRRESVVTAHHRAGRWRQGRATLRLRLRNGRRLAFGDLPVEVARSFAAGLADQPAAARAASTRT